MAPLKQHIGFLGGGQMASALMTGFVKAEAVGGVSQISVSEPFEPMRTAMPRRLGDCVQPGVARRSDVIFLAVKPDVIATVLKETPAAVAAHHLDQGGHSLEDDAAAPARRRAVVRVMPNLPCVVVRWRQASRAAAVANDMKLVGRLLDCVGRWEQVPGPARRGHWPLGLRPRVRLPLDRGPGRRRRARGPAAAVRSLAAQTLKGAACGPRDRQAPACSRTSCARRAARPSRAWRRSSGAASAPPR